MTLQLQPRDLLPALALDRTIGPPFMDGIVLLGIAATIVATIGTALLVCYAIIAGVMRRWHR